MNFDKSQLIYLYTDIYNQCIINKNVEKMFSLYSFYLNLFLKKRMDEKSLEYIIDTLDKYEFLKKNFNYMFCYLDRIFIFNSKPSLENNSIKIFNRNYNFFIQNILMDVIFSQGYSFNHLILILIYKFKLMNLDLDIIEASLIQASKKYYITLNYKFKNLNEILEFYNFHKDEQFNLCKKLGMTYCFDKIHHEFIIQLSKQNYYGFIKEEIDHLLSDFNKLYIIFIIQKQNFNEIILEKIHQSFDLNFLLFIDNLFQKLDNDILDSYKEIMKNKFSSILFIKKFIHLFLNNIEYQIFFNYICKKDEFIDLYKKNLLNRLINNHDLSNEFLFLDILKKYFNRDLIYKLDIILNDYFQSILNTRSYKSNIKTSIWILSQQFYPFISPTLPSSIFNLKSDVLSFYKNLYPNRNLIFDYYHSSVILDAHYSNKLYIFQMSLIQFIVLCKILDNNSPISHHNLKCELNLNDDLLTAILHSLCRPQNPLLIKSGYINEIDLDNDLFSLNQDFNKTSGTMIKFSMPEKLRETTNKSFDLEKRFILRSKIIYLLKFHLSLSFSQLYEKICNIIDDKNLIYHELNYLIDYEYIEFKESIYFYIP